ncbi:MAG: ATP-binding cassette domain-containing protein [Deltaproteobacteria bacterium]|nr:ATP-binding cassette domain-containing protein [Deltaproteobacteria bacterium]
MIRVENLSVRTAAGAVLLEPLSFELPPGGGLFVVGGSGSGKTSLVEALAGVSPHRVQGTFGMPRPALLAVQDAGRAFSPYRRVGPQLEDSFPRSARAAARALLSELLAAVGLDPGLTGRYPHELSAGMLRRVLVAGVLAAGPATALLDEPTAGLDPSTRWTILDLLRERRCPVVVTTHDPDLLRHATGFHALVLCRGRLVESGPVEEILSAPSQPYTRSLLHCEEAT